MVKKRFSVIPKSIKAKYSWGDNVPASGIYECSVCGNYQAFKKGESFSQCQDCINSRREEENKWYVTNEFVYFLSKNMNIEFENISSFHLKIADKITEWSGSMGFVYIHTLWFALWILANEGYFGPKYVFDPFPYGLLTMIVSLEAIFLATFIMISQNIANKKSELRAEHEYQVNLETEKNVAELLAMIKEMRKESELKNEAIEDIKETVEELVEGVDEKRDEGEKKEEVSEKVEEETEKILDEAGIDIIDTIQESADEKLERKSVVEHLPSERLKKAKIKKSKKVSHKKRDSNNKWISKRNIRKKKNIRRSISKRKI